MLKLKGVEMNWKNRLTNYNFWISIFSAVLLILQALKIEFDIAYVNEIFTAVLGLLVVIGIISDPTRTSVKSIESTKTQETEKEVNVSETQNQEINETLPIREENEIDNDNLKNDIQAILTKISLDLGEKINELKQIKSSENIQQKNLITSNETKVPTKEVEILPAAAETENPYIDVIN